MYRDCFINVCVALSIPYLMSYHKKKKKKMQELAFVSRKKDSIFSPSLTSLSHPFCMMVFNREKSLSSKSLYLFEWLILWPYSKDKS
jgi:hypothetical protein